MKKILITLTLIMVISIGFTQSVKNINAKVVNDKVQINFEIVGLNYYQEVTKANLYVSFNGGEFKGPLKEVDGDISEGLTNGQHTIIWDALKEMPFTDEALVFDIRLKVVEKDRSKKFFVTLAGNDVTPLGLRIGQLGKTGWYFEARGSLKAMTSPNYNYDGNKINDYEKPGYYEFTGTGGWQAYSVLVGATQQLSINTFIYAGVGYGVENYIMEINEYDYNQTQSTGNDWVKYEKYSNAGVEIDAGVMFKYKKLLLGAGGTALNFKSFGWSASIGYSF